MRNKSSATYFYTALYNKSVNISAKQAKNETFLILTNFRSEVFMRQSFVTQMLMISIKLNSKVYGKTECACCS